MARYSVADADKVLEIEAAYALEELTNRLAEIGADQIMAAAESGDVQAIERGWQKV